MYLTELHIHNLKRVESLQLSFADENGNPRQLTVIIGPNGTAKTTILQAIALSLVDQSAANVLAVDQLPFMRSRHLAQAGEPAVRILTNQALQHVGDTAFRGRGYSLEPKSGWIRHEELAGFRFRSPASGRVENGAWMTVEEASPPHASENESFCVGYGVARSLPDAMQSLSFSQPSVDRLRTLFSSHFRLTALSFANYFSDVTRYERLVHQALTGVAYLVPGLSGVSLQGTGGVRSARDVQERARFDIQMGESRVSLPSVAISHGYQSMAAWVSDLIGFALLENPELETLNDIRGIVLIDEVDAFLHPQWQQHLLPAICKTFPAVQFIVSTHSPLLLSAVHPQCIVRLGFDERTGSVVRVVRDAESGELRPSKGIADVGVANDPRLLSGSELFDDYFGVDGLQPGSHGHQLHELMTLQATLARSANPPNSSQLESTPVRSSKKEPSAASIRKRIKELQKGLESGPSTMGGNTQ